MIARLRAAASFANVTACLALFVALGGTGYAALKLPRDSVGSREVKDRSLRLRDIRSADRERLRGTRGRQGPTGPQGPIGLTGPVGPSVVLFTGQRSSELIRVGGNAVVVRELDLPGGAWLLHATLTLTSTSSSEHVRAVCAVQDRFGVTTVAAGQSTRMAIQYARPHTPGKDQVSLACHTTGNPGTPDVEASEASLSAISTGTVDLRP